MKTLFAILLLAGLAFGQEKPKTSTVKPDSTMRWDVKVETIKGYTAQLQQLRDQYLQQNAYIQGKIDERNRMPDSVQVKK